MVCPVCGRDSEVGIFCYECYLKKNLKAELPTVVEVQHCRGCGSFLLNGKWFSGMDERDVVKRVVSDAFKTNIKGLDRAGVQDVETSRRGSEYDASVRIKLGDFERVTNTIARIKNVACQDCSRKAGGYFEAVIQLRGGVSKKTVEEIVNSAKKAKDKNSFVSEVRKVPGGYDIYLGSKKTAEKIMKRFRGQAEVKKSFKQAGLDKQRSKDLYRFYYLVRLE